MKCADVGTTFYFLLSDKKWQPWQLCGGRVIPGHFSSGRGIEGSSDRWTSLVLLHLPYLLGVFSSVTWIFALPSLPRNLYVPGFFFPNYLLCSLRLFTQKGEVQAGQRNFHKITKIESKSYRHFEVVPSTVAGERIRHHYHRWSEQNLEISELVYITPFIIHCFWTDQDAGKTSSLSEDSCLQ